MFLVVWIEFSRHCFQSVIFSLSLVLFKSKQNKITHKQYLKNSARQIKHTNTSVPKHFKKNNLYRFSKKKNRAARIEETRVAPSPARTSRHRLSAPSYTLRVPWPRPVCTRWLGTPPTSLLPHANVPFNTHFYCVPSSRESFAVLWFGIGAVGPCAGNFDSCKIMPLKGARNCSKKWTAGHLSPRCSYLTVMRGIAAIELKPFCN